MPTVCGFNVSGLAFSGVHHHSNLHSTAGFVLHKRPQTENWTNQLWAVTSLTQQSHSPSFSCSKLKILNLFHMHWYKQKFYFSFPIWGQLFKFFTFHNLNIQQKREVSNTDSHEKWIAVSPFPRMWLAVRYFMRTCYVVIHELMIKVWVEKFDDQHRGTGFCLIV